MGVTHRECLLINEVNFYLYPVRITRQGPCESLLKYKNLLASELDGHWAVAKISGYLVLL